MNKNIILLIMFTLYITDMPLYSQDSSYVAYEDDLYKLEVIVLHDTILVQDTTYVSKLDDVTRIFGISFDQYSKELLKAVELRDSAKVLSLERIYLNYLMPMYYPSFLKHRYIVRNYTIDISDNNLKLDINNMRLPFFSLRDSLKIDVMLTCRGDVNTDNFLKSTAYRSSCLEQLFLSIDNVRLSNIKGVNLYFPDFSFKEKRAMAQFVKSASLIIDSCHIPSIRNIGLYVTFDKDTGKKHKDYLFSLSQMADSIFLVNSKSVSWPRDSLQVISKANAGNNSWTAKVVNQIYLARFNMKPFPQTSDKELTPSDLRILADSDYPDNNWEIYLFILTGTFVVMIVMFVLYRFVSRFGYFVDNHIAYFFSLIILIIIEIYLLFVCMIEAMSNDQVFTFGGENKNTFLLMPLLFTFIIPMLNLINKRKEKP